MQRVGTINKGGAVCSEAVVAGELIYFSGITAADRAADIHGQMTQCLNRLNELLSELGEDSASIVMVHVWLKDMRYFSAMNKAWNEWVEQGVAPARTCVSGELLTPDTLVEVVATATRAGAA